MFALTSSNSSRAVFISFCNQSRFGLSTQPTSSPIVHPSSVMICPSLAMLKCSYLACSPRLVLYVLYLHFLYHSCIIVSLIIMPIVIFYPLLYNILLPINHYTGNITTKCHSKSMSDNRYLTGTFHQKVSSLPVSIA